jgi:hypothetical protein
LQVLFVKVQGKDTTPFGAGKYDLTLDFGANPAPAVPVPVTTTPNGAVISNGGGQAIKLNSEFLVNTTTADTQETTAGARATAMDPSGNFVVVWESHNQDGSGWGVCAQRYNADGSPNGGEFQVNTWTQGDQKHSSVAMDALGGFVVTWSSYGQDGSGWGVYAQRYNADGSPNGGEFQVNTWTQGDQMYPTAAMDAAGNFVITWSSYGQDGSGWGVYAQQYTTAGIAVGGELRVNTTTTGDQRYSSVALDDSGDAVVAWSGNGAGDSSGVYARRFLLQSQQGSGNLRSDLASAARDAMPVPGQPHPNCNCPLCRAAQARWAAAHVRPPAPAEVVHATPAAQAGALHPAPKSPLDELFPSFRAGPALIGPDLVPPSDGVGPDAGLVEAWLADLAALAGTAPQPVSSGKRPQQVPEWAPAVPPGLDWAFASLGPAVNG